MPSSSLTPNERVLRARAASHASWSNTADPPHRTAPARRRFMARFIDEVDPGRVLPEADRLRRAESARKAYFASLALKSAKARRARAETRKGVR